jgi:hypothetical protein
MARRTKQVATQSIDSTTIGEGAPLTGALEPSVAVEAAAEAGETTTAVLEFPEPPVRQWRPNPSPMKDVDLDGYQLRLQESRPPKDDASVTEADAGDANRPERRRWEIQIEFGDGSRNDMPSEGVLDFIKSHRLKVKTKAGEEREVPMFHWNDLDRAWGMGIDYEAPATSRNRASAVFREVVEMVAQERGVGRQL